MCVAVSQEACHRNARHTIVRGDICLHFTHDAFTTHYLPEPRWHRYDMNNYWYRIKACITHCLKKETTHWSIPRMRMSSIMWKSVFWRNGAEDFQCIAVLLKSKLHQLQQSRHIGFVLNPGEQHCKHHKHIPYAGLFQNAALCNAFQKRNTDCMCPLRIKQFPNVLRRAQLKNFIWMILCEMLSLKSTWHQHSPCLFYQTPFVIFTQFINSRKNRFVTILI